MSKVIQSEIIISYSPDEIEVLDDVLEFVQFHIELFKFERRHVSLVETKINKLRTSMNHAKYGKTGE